MERKNVFPIPKIFLVPPLLLLLVFVLSGCSGSGTPPGESAATNRMGGAIQKGPLSLSLQVSTIAGLPPVVVDGTGADTTFVSPRSIATDGTNLFVTDTEANVIRRVVIATAAVSTLAGSPGLVGSADGTGTDARFNSPDGIATDGTYLFIADTGNNTIRKVEIATGAVTTLAGRVGTAGNSDGAGVDATFNYPSGIATDGTSLFVADTRNNRIRTVSITTGEVTTISSFGIAVNINSPGAIATDGQTIFIADDSVVLKISIATGNQKTLAGSYSSPTLFGHPYGIAIAGANLYVTDAGNNHAIRRVAIATGEVTTFAGTIGARGAADGTGANARFYLPWGIATDGTSLYVTDGDGARTIRKIAISSGDVTTLAGKAAVGAADGPGAAATFTTPMGITTDGKSLYIADTGNNSIRKVVIETGTVSTIAGTPGTSGSADGTRAAASFNQPRWITTDGESLYLSDTMNNTIRKIVIASGVVTTFAGRPGVDGATDGTGTEALFSFPEGITTDGKFLYVADSGNYTIRKISIATKKVTTIAGAAGEQGTADGTETARFTWAHGVTTDGNSLYIADSSRIRKMLLATGTVTTLAGGISAIYSFADGAGPDARFGEVVGITTDGTTLYVTDLISNTIRLVSVATGTVTTPGNPFLSGAVDGSITSARFVSPTGITTDGSRLYVVDSFSNLVRRIE